MPEKILLVDDDIDFREELHDYLDGYNVIEAPNGIEALKLLKRANEIGVVILDVMMPGLSGTDVLGEMKKIDPNLGVVILTGHGSKDVVVEALKGRADDYIEKPSGIEKIKESIDRLLARRHGEPAIDISDTKGKILKIRHFIEKNCFKKTTLKDAAESVCLSPKYLSRIFKEDTGIGFSEYKLGVKVKQSEKLLKDTSLNVEQISDKLGYQNSESFIRVFKKSIGLTPTEYRRKVRNKSRAPDKKRKAGARNKK